MKLSSYFPNFSAIKPPERSPEGNSGSPEGVNPMGKVERRIILPSAGAGDDQAPELVIDPLLGALVDPETGEIVEYLTAGTPEVPAPAPAGAWRPPVEVLGAVAMWLSLIHI